MLEISVLKIPDDVPFEVAALVGCGVVTGLGAVFYRAKVAGTPYAVFDGVEVPTETLVDQAKLEKFIDDQLASPAASAGASAAASPAAS